MNATLLPLAVDESKIKNEEMKKIMKQILTYALKI